MGGNCFKQDKVTFNQKIVVCSNIVFEINLCSFKDSSDFSLRNSLFGDFLVK